MSAILSAQDLNDFISPGVACIKPVETLPAVPAAVSNPYEVTTEDQIAATHDKLQAAQISLTDCLACSGCVTSAEAVLVSLQSHNEVLHVLDSEPSLSLPTIDTITMDVPSKESIPTAKRKLFIASISPQTRASLAAALSTTTDKVANMIDHLLLSAITQDGQKRGFDYVLDTTPLLSVCLQLAAQEVQASLVRNAEGVLPKPILTSECPGFICYLEKTHPTVLPHLSRLKSPQAILGTLLKSLLPKYLSDSSMEIYHVAVMPCFDKKLEASRAELTDVAWKETNEETAPVRDVDCVITTRELLQLASARGVEFTRLSTEPLSVKKRLPIPAFEQLLSQVSSVKSISAENQALQTGTSGGYLISILQSFQTLNPSSTMIEKRGRNADIVEYSLVSADGTTEIVKMARYYGFKNITNLVRRLKPSKLKMLPGSAAGKGRVVGRGSRAVNASTSNGTSSEYAYVEVMACPGGCTNGGGQLKGDGDVATIGLSTDTDLITDISSPDEAVTIAKNRLDAKEWLAKVDEAYFSADEGSPEPEDLDHNTIHDTTLSHRGMNRSQAIDTFLGAWTVETGIPLEKLAYTTYRAVESDVGKPKNGEMTTVQAAELASKIGGGW